MPPLSTRALTESTLNRVANALHTRTRGSLLNGRPRAADSSQSPRQVPVAACFGKPPFACTCAPCRSRAVPQRRAACSLRQRQRHACQSLTCHGAARATDQVLLMEVRAADTSRPTAEGPGWCKPMGGGCGGRGAGRDGCCRGTRVATQMSLASNAAYVEGTPIPIMFVQ